LGLPNEGFADAPLGISELAAPEMRVRSITQSL
jgi:hypothetical protein